MWSNENEHNENWITPALQGFATRHVVRARRDLFKIGDRVEGYYILISGDLLAYKTCTHVIAGGPKSQIRYVFPDELIVFEGAGKHVASCSAITDCIVLRIKRERMIRLTALDPILESVITRLHANEADWILQTRFAGLETQFDQPDL